MTDALLLAGGGFKTVGYLGVLEARWAELRRTLRCLCGVSAGAVLALLLAVGYDPAELQARVHATAWAPLLHRIFCPAQLWAAGAPCSVRPLRQLLQAWLHDKGVPADATFAWLARQGAPGFACVVACVDTGELLLLDAARAPRCSLVRAVLASAAVPFAFPPVRVAGRRCVDAGLVNNAPASLLRRAWPQCRQMLVLTPSGLCGAPAHPWAALLWHRTNFVTHAELLRCRALAAVVLELPPAPADVHIFSPGASVSALLRQGRVTALCHERRAAVAGLAVLAVARLGRPPRRGAPGKDGGAAPRALPRR